MKQQIDSGFVAYKHRVRTVPDSDGLCSYLIRTPAGTYVSQVTPLATTLSYDDALVFLWPSSEVGARFLALATADVRLSGSAPIRRSR